MEKLPVRVPESFEKAMGYDGELKWVAFYWEPCGDEARYDDGFCSADCNWHGFLAFTNHPRISPLLKSYNLGSSDFEADHWLLVDLIERELYVGSKTEIKGFIRKEIDKETAEVESAPEVEISPEMHREIFENVMAEVRTIKPPSMEDIEKRLAEESEATVRMVQEMDGDNEDFIRELEMKGLTLGAELPTQKVHDEICPECPFKTAYCEFRMSLSVAHPELRFVCPGMRAWIRKNN